MLSWTWRQRTGVDLAPKYLRWTRRWEIWSFDVQTPVKRTRPAAGWPFRVSFEFISGNCREVQRGEALFDRHSHPSETSPTAHKSSMPWAQWWSLVPSGLPGTGLQGRWPHHPPWSKSHARERRQENQEWQSLYKRVAKLVTKQEEKQGYSLQAGLVPTEHAYRPGWRKAILYLAKKRRFFSLEKGSLLWKANTKQQPRPCPSAEATGSPCTPHCHPHPRSITRRGLGAVEEASARSPGDPRSFAAAPTHNTHTRRSRCRLRARTRKEAQLFGSFIIDR